VKSWTGLLAAMLLAPAAGLAAPLSPLVDVAWVEANGERDDVVLLDIRNRIDGGSRQTFAEGHVPGAIHSDYLQDGWRTTVDGVVGQTPPVANLEALIGGLGIDGDRTVVVIPAGVSSTDLGSATRVYWTFKYLGHDRVAILDGGHRAWVEAGKPLESGLPEPEARTFVASVRPELLADTAFVESRLGTSTVLLDARPNARYVGDAKHGAARTAGHIPAATSFDHAQAFDQSTGRLKNATDIRALLPAAALAEDAEIVSYCNTGHWASVNWFVMSEVLGVDGVKLYDGSMVGWTQDPARPVEK
jgi:thiosulfate/3-mercaptopyruvate sulfurtransferase